MSTIKDVIVMIRKNNSDPKTIAWNNGELPFGFSQRLSAGRPVTMANNAPK